MEYINFIKAKAHISTATKAERPVLSEEDEQFLNRITSDENPPPLPVRPTFVHGGDAQIALMDGAQNIALPPATPGEMTPREEPEIMPGVTSKSPANPRKPWSWMRRDSRDSKRNTTAAGLHDIAQGLKPADAQPNEDGTVEDAEAKKEEEDMTVILEQLNLAAVNNRVFSISDETQQLLIQFNQVFKDLMNGVPTAYRDLESLLTNGDKQLQKTYNGLPSFLQKLIEKLPETMTKGLAPEIMAVAAERASRSGINMEKAGMAAGLATKMLKTPSLKDLVGKPGAVAGMLRSIVEFLRARFPAFLGMNVLWSLAMFVLLFVFWYCYKRGKEERLAKERDLTEQEVQQLEKDYQARQEQQDKQGLQNGNHSSPYLPTTTTAPPGASMEDVRQGVIEAEAMKAAIAAEAEASSSAASGPKATAAKQ